MMKMNVLVCMLMGMLICCKATMNINFIKSTPFPEAKCLDGSPPAYYFRPASKSEDSDKWVIYIQGGGWCYKDEACLARAETRLGSSKKMEHTLNMKGILSEAQADNPEFYSWNHVVFAYCDGASFTGMRSQPVTVKGKHIYYRGYYNLKAIVHDLMTHHGMNHATQVILTGGSAGGAATFIHADHIASMLPKTVRRYKAAPFSGMFLRHTNVENKVVYEEQIKHVFKMQNSSYGVDVHCLVGKSEDQKHLCMFGQETIKYSLTPLFVFNSLYDEWSLRCILTAEPVAPSSSANYNCTAVPGWKECVMNETCSKTQWNELNTKWGDDYRAMIKTNKGLAARGNGLFAYSCNMHGAEIQHEHWNRLKVHGTTMREAFVKWYKSTNEEASKHTYVDCKIDGNFKCNPTCHL